MCRLLLTVTALTSFATRVNECLAFINRYFLPFPFQISPSYFDGFISLDLSFCNFRTFQTNFCWLKFLLFRNIRLCSCYSTVQIYFIKSSENSVPWNFNAKLSISSFKESRCWCKSMLFGFITNPSIFSCNSFPRLARWFFGFTWPSFLYFS